MGQRRFMLAVTVAVAVASAAGCGAGPVTDVPASGQQDRPAPTSTSVSGPGQAPEPTEPSPTSTVAVLDGRRATVSSVADGDTVTLDGAEKVRLIGVDAPESTTLRYGHVECFGAEATAHLRALLPAGTEVLARADVEARDRYGRSLLYLWRVSDGLFINEALAADGYAQVLTIPPNVAYAETFTEAVRVARNAGRGLWSACSSTTADAPATSTQPSPASAPPSPPPSSTATPTAPTGPCDAAYPGVCIPPGPPDLDCGDITDRRFEVRAPDPHRFDSDGDGVGCES